jgi:hypothetical protein
LSVKQEARRRSSIGLSVPRVALLASLMAGAGATIGFTLAVMDVNPRITAGWIAVLVATLVGAAKQASP